MYVRTYAALIVRFPEAHTAFHWVDDDGVHERYFFMQPDKQKLCSADKQLSVLHEKNAVHTDPVMVCSKATT